MIRARARTMVHVTRLQLQLNRARRRERDALRQAGELVAASMHVPPGEAQALQARIRRLVADRDADSSALATSLEADRADYVTVAGWMRPLVVIRGLCARALLRHRIARCHHDLSPLHERLGAVALTEQGSVPDNLRMSGAPADKARSARAELESIVAERARHLAPFEGRALPRWAGNLPGEGKALWRALAQQAQVQLFPRASALAGLAAGWWVGHTYTDSRPRSVLRSLGIGQGGTHVVSGETYRAMSFWLPIVAAAIAAYLSDRAATWVQRRYRPYDRSSEAPSSEFDPDRVAAGVAGATSGIE
jgi:hypothetical protein